MSNQEQEPADLAGLLTSLAETPHTLSALIEEIRALSEPPALAGGQSEPPASAGGPSEQPAPTTHPPADAGGSDNPPADAGGSDNPPADAGGPSGQPAPTTHPPADAGGSDNPPADAGGSDKALRWRSADGEFSALENVCHLRDIEAEGYAIRIRRILDDTNPLLADIDGGRLAIERAYNDQDPDLALHAFISARAENLEKLRAADTKGLEREGTLEGVGRVTLKRLAEMMREHDEGHVEDLRVLHQRLKRLRD